MDFNTKCNAIDRQRLHRALLRLGHLLPRPAVDSGLVPVALVSDASELLENEGDAAPVRLIAQVIAIETATPYPLATRGWVRPGLWRLH